MPYDGTNKNFLTLGRSYIKSISRLMVFVSPAKQKRDICTAFPAASLSSAAAASLSLVAAAA